MTDIQPTIITISPKHLIGIRTTMSLSDYRIQELWKNFMPRKHEVVPMDADTVVSAALYDSTYFESFQPEKTFEKWASVEVPNTTSPHEGMESLTIPGGLYAVFPHKGTTMDFSIFNYIFRTWIPSSGYKVDHRPHFEIIRIVHSGNSNVQEEDLYIPIGHE
jgi:AraC family transcriptional regulator